jgi:hypothetical protein
LTGSAIIGPTGDALDGDGDGVAGGDFVRTFPASGWLQLSEGATYVFGGTPGSEALTVTKGTLTFLTDAAVAGHAGLQLRVHGPGAAVEMNADQHLAELTLTSGATVTVGAGAAKLVLGSLDLDGSSTLELATASLLVRNGTVGSWNGSTYTGITGLIASGLNGGAWDGSGIVTSGADALGVLTTLAPATVGEVLGIGAGGDTSVWNGETVTAGDVIVKYTYAGDANLDGEINADDYALIDFNAHGQLTLGYYNGDFNVDGSVNADDYALIDFNLNAQGLPL